MLSALVVQYQDLVVFMLLLLSIVELAVCLCFAALESRKKTQTSIGSTQGSRAHDAFATWIGVLERQSDRRNVSRYEGVERRTRLRKPQYATK